MRYILWCAALTAFLGMPSMVATESSGQEIVCQKSFFTPDTIHLKKGEQTRIVLRSSDVTHGFAVDEFSIAREVPAGPPTVVEFTPDRAGEFPFYCVVRCGKNHRLMRGKFIVE